MILTGYRDISAGLSSYSDTGFNANTTFSVSYNGSSQEFSGLFLNGINHNDPTQTPEPTYSAAILLAIGGVVLLFRRRIRPSAFRG